MAGLSDAERDAEPALQSSEGFIERYDVTTPPMTPPQSVTPTPRTPVPSLPDEAPAVPASVEPPLSVPTTQPPPAVQQPPARMIDAATECVL